MTWHDGRVSEADLGYPDDDHLDMLLAAVTRGQHGAFALVFGQLANLINARIRAMVPDHGQAEEVAQEVFLEIWQQAGRFDPGQGSAIAGAATIARHRASDRIRAVPAASEREQRTAVITQPGADLNQLVPDASGREKLRRCLEQLSGPQRQAIELAFCGGHSYAEVAEILSIPVGTAMTHIRAALIRLRALMQTTPLHHGAGTCGAAGGAP